MYVTKLIRRYLNKKAMKKKGKDIEMIDISEEEKKAFAEKFKGIELFKHLNDDAICWVVFIFYLSWMQENENEKLWEDFKEEITYKSRFFPKSEFLKKVDNVADYASAELCKGTVLYRAREYTNKDFAKNKELITFCQKLNEFFPQLKLQPEFNVSESAVNLIILGLAGDTNRKEELQQKVMEIVAEERPFWGFKESDCDAPPKEYAKTGRANSVGISFLYAALDKKTAITEMRP